MQHQQPQLSWSQAFLNSIHTMGSSDFTIGCGGRGFGSTAVVAADWLAPSLVAEVGSVGEGKVAGCLETATN